MKESIGMVIEKGFSTWKRNLSIAFPFVLEFFMAMVIFGLAIFAFVLFFVVPALDKNNIDPEQMDPESLLLLIGFAFSDHIIGVFLLVLVFLLLYMFMSSFFMAGAIGMSKNASEKGDTRISDMFSYGAKNARNMFFTRIMISLLALAGVIFLVPGILSIDNIDTFLNDPVNSMASMSVITFGLLLWSLYILMISVLFLFVEHALVIEETDPITAIETGIRFFLSNKAQSLTLWFILITISFILSIIGNALNSVGILAELWNIFNYAISIAVIQPLVTIWWTRFYLNRTGRKLYSFEEYVLSH